MAKPLATIVGFWLFLSATVTVAHGDHESHGDMFYANLLALCGARFEGTVAFPEDPGDAFRDQRLRARIDWCGKREIWIPFAVGEDRSRTWIITRKPEGLELRHQHRHADDSPHELTGYGGTASAEGTEWRQSFPADAHTAALIPEAATNVWTLSLSDDGTELVYDLTRHGAPRFRAVLRRLPPTARD